MSYHLYTIFFITLLFVSTVASAMAINASTFNATYSCTSPFVATQTTTITLDENIVINASGECELFQVGGGFNVLTDTITFTATNGNAVVVTSSTAWKISLPVVFTGNAQLQVQNGATLWFNGGSLLLNSSSLMTQVAP